jgi:hypothetical protein
MPSSKEEEQVIVTWEFDFSSPIMMWQENGQVLDSNIGKLIHTFYSILI